jgi:hypothetical protein
MGKPTILHHGKIAINSKPYFADAIAVDDGKVSSVGHDSDVLRIKTPETRLVDHRPSGCRNHRLGEAIWRSGCDWFAFCPDALWEPRFTRTDEEQDERSARIVCGRSICGRAVRGHQSEKPGAAGQCPAGTFWNGAGRAGRWLGSHHEGERSPCRVNLCYRQALESAWRNGTAGLHSASRGVRKCFDEDFCTKAVMAGRPPVNSTIVAKYQTNPSTAAHLCGEPAAASAATARQRDQRAGRFEPKFFFREYPSWL